MSAGFQLERVPVGGRSSVARTRAWSWLSGGLLLLAPIYSLYTRRLRVLVRTDRPLAGVYWPAFRELDLLRAVRTFQQRERRFGR